MKSLISKGIIPDVIYGTSTGALQAAGYCKLGIDGLEAVWTSLTGRSDVFRYNWRRLFRDGKYDMLPLEEKLNKINNMPRQPGNSCNAIVTRVCLETGEIEYIDYNHPEFLRSALASAAVPFLVKPIDINGRQYVDGGVRDQIPIKDIRRLLIDGYKVYVVATNPIRVNPLDSWRPGRFPLWSIWRVSQMILCHASRG
jgi:NTE family protein